MLGYVLQGDYLIESQGYTVHSNVLFQENISAMLLENNVRMSSGKGTKHIKARYFLIVDKIQKRELDIQHFPLDQMWDGVLNKPIQVKVFRVIHGHMMNGPKQY